MTQKIPNGPISDKWTNYKNHINLVNPANKRNLDVIVVGTGLAGGSASATLAELGYNVKSFVSKIHRVARTLLRHKVELTQQKLPRRRRFRFQVETVRRRLSCT
jgi:hypothetical protein